MPTEPKSKLEVKAAQLLSLLETNKKNASLIRTLAAFAETMVTAANTCFVNGDIDRASALFISALNIKYALLLRDRSYTFLDRVNFEITSVCNLHCKYCTFQSGKRKAFIEPELYRKILTELAQKAPHLKRLALYMSGESLMHPAFIEILEITRAIKDAYPAFTPLTYLHTNGMLWTPQMNDRILKIGALDQVTWSIDGVDKPSFEHMRYGARFETVMKNFEHFLSTCPPFVTTVVNHIVEPGDAQRALCLEMASAFAKVDTVNTIEPKALNINAPDHSSVKWLGTHDGFCEYIFHTVIVTTEGKMSLCCADYNSVNAFGDIGRDGFEATYYGEERARLLQLMAKGRRCEIKGCKTCSLLRNAWSTDSHSVKAHEPLLLRAFVRERLQRLAGVNNIRRIAVFGAGKHTQWLEKTMEGLDLPVVAVLDDEPNVQKVFFGKSPVKAANFDPTTVDAILLSTDCMQPQMTTRCRELYNDKIKLIDLYEGLPSGPYKKGV